MAQHGICETCGCPLVEFNGGFIADDDDDIRWASCGLVEAARELLRDLRAGEADALAQLAAWEPPCDIARSTVGHLIREAQDAARRGDIGEAMHRLRLAAEPKWKHLDYCAAAYAAAMSGRAWPPIGA